MFAARAHGHRICARLLVQITEKRDQSEMFDNGRASEEVQRKHGGAVPPDIPEKMVSNSRNWCDADKTWVNQYFEEDI